LRNVTIINYRGEELYAINTSSGFDSQPVAYTVWFTNDTIFCVSPLLSNYSLCPVHPYIPVIAIGVNSTSSLNETDGIRIDLRISTNSSGAGFIFSTAEGIYVSGDLFNTLSANNSLSDSNSWSIPQSEMRMTCGTFPQSFAVYQGDYSQANFTQATPLSLNSPQVGMICPSPPSNGYVDFSPQSETASAPAGVLSPRPTTEKITLSDYITGYWTGQASSPSFKPFPPGSYTIVVMDEWGDSAILHFAVES
jgi:hypothetical protein